VKKTTHRKSRKPTGKYAPLIRELRRQVELIEEEPVRQSDFATYFDVAPITITRWESGWQDPPPKKLQHLAILSCNCMRPDLEVAFGGGDANSPRDKTDYAISMLLKCLFQLRASGRRAQADAIHAAAQAVFNVARDIVRAAHGQETRMPAGEAFLLREMERHLKQIYDHERGLFGEMGRAVGAKMYTTKESEK
jgi:DNA-binding transcriptional regulator YiaG